MNGFLVIALAVSVALNLWQLDRAATARGKASGDIAVVESANAAGLAAVGELRQAVAECYAGRVFDRVASAQAAAEREAERNVMAARHNREAVALAELLAGQCREWADRPACGVVVQ